MQTIPSRLSRILILLIQGYRWLISPWFWRSCRFHPTCSQYALDALAAHGTLRGSWFALRRLCRCHPWHPGGFDPVPPVKSDPVHSTHHG